ncbi:MAG: hypothetical protein HUJ90_08190 [Bacteroidales bacterium]|nr:hypothetical protein [Bacteroidales bacterium]
MKNNFFILLVLCTIGLSSCGASSYSSNVYDDAVYYRPNRVREIAIQKERDEELYKLRKGETYAERLRKFDDSNQSLTINLYTVDPWYNPWWGCGYGWYSPWRWNYIGMGWASSWIWVDHWIYDPWDPWGPWPYGPGWYHPIIIETRDVAYGRRTTPSGTAEYSRSGGSYNTITGSGSNSGRNSAVSSAARSSYSSSERSTSNVRSAYSTNGQSTRSYQSQLQNQSTQNVRRATTGNSVNTMQRSATSTPTYNTGGGNVRSAGGNYGGGGGFTGGGFGGGGFSGGGGNVRSAGGGGRR